MIRVFSTSYGFTVCSYGYATEGRFCLRFCLYSRALTPLAEVPYSLNTESLSRTSTFYILSRYGRGAGAALSRLLALVSSPEPDERRSASAEV